MNVKQEVKRVCCFCCGSIRTLGCIFEMSCKEASYLVSLNLAGLFQRSFF